MWCSFRRDIDVLSDATGSKFLSKNKSNYLQHFAPAIQRQPLGDVSHKADGRLPLLSARPAVTLANLKRAATSSTAW